MAHGDSFLTVSLMITIATRMRSGLTLGSIPPPLLCHTSSTPPHCPTALLQILDHSHMLLCHSRLFLLSFQKTHQVLSSLSPCPDSLCEMCSYLRSYMSASVSQSLLKDSLYLSSAIYHLFFKSQTPNLSITSTSMSKFVAITTLPPLHLSGFGRIESRIVELKHIAHAAVSPPTSFFFCTIYSPCIFTSMMRDIHLAPDLMPFYDAS